MNAIFLFQFFNIRPHIPVAGFQRLFGYDCAGDEARRLVEVRRTGPAGLPVTGLERTVV